MEIIAFQGDITQVDVDAVVGEEIVVGDLVVILGKQPVDLGKEAGSADVQDRAGRAELLYAEFRPQQMNAEVDRA